MGKRWGLKANVSTWLYNTVIRPVLSYAAVIWWHASGRINSVRSQEKVQRCALQYITGAARSTPTDALQFYTGMTPIGLSITGEAIKGYIRLKRNHDWKAKTGENTGHLRIRDQMIEKLTGLPHKSDVITDKWLPKAKFDIAIESRQWWTTKMYHQPHRKEQ